LDNLSYGRPCKIPKTILGTIVMSFFSFNLCWLFFSCFFVHYRVPLSLQLESSSWKWEELKVPKEKGVNSKRNGLCEGCPRPWKIILHKKIRDYMGKMNFVAFGVYSITFHVNFDFVGTYIFFQFFSIIT
jgi:hypothetical protein